MLRIAILLLALSGLFHPSANAQLEVDKLPADLAQKVDQLVDQALRQTGVPSASLASGKESSGNAE